MMYRVTKRYARGPESNVGSFKTIPEARDFIQQALEEDLRLKLITTYSIYEGADLFEEIDASKIETSSDAKQPETPDSSQSQGAGRRFSPTPLPSRPAPKGMPHSPWKDDEENKDN